MRPGALGIASVARVVGILGGMGPEATVMLLQPLIIARPVTDDADHIPLLVNRNPQVPSRLGFMLDGEPIDPGPTLVSMAKGLQTSGAAVLAMPCAVAHRYQGQIEEAVDVPLLDMVRLSADAAATLTCTGVGIGILGSPAVRKLALFDAALRAAGLEPVYPSDEAALLAAIRQINTEGPVVLARSTMGAASAELLAQGVHVQIIACVEFSLIASALPAGVQPIDTLDQLVAEIIALSTANPTPSETTTSRRSRGAVSKSSIDQQGKEFSLC